MPDRAPRLLVVRDDPDTGAIVRDVMAARGYSAECITNDQATMARLSAAPPDLIVLDMFTPLLRDWPILDNLLRIPRAPPLVALTNRSLSPDALAAVTFHGRGHLQKPFEPAALIRLCERMTAPAAPPPAGVAQDRRQQPRYRFAGDATILTANGRPAIVLQMLDVSASGAKVEVGNLLEKQLVPGAAARMLLSLPPKFQPRAVDVRVDWRSDGLIGISFSAV